MHGLRDGLAGRIIPAYAGSTARPRSIVVGSADHPRIRGEHLVTIGSSMLPSGSSPHTRGARDLRRSRALLPGIIPAYAGSTAPEAAGQDRKRDHPRIRGEHVTPLPGETLACGSSPHTRGAPRQASRRRRQQRIIPAYAGSTSASKPSAPPATDHPRIRGEHSTSSGPFQEVSGSSPHTRGARHADPRRDARMRIIPAYAGSTQATLRRRHSRPDHPRIRGEHVWKPAETPKAAGSSPHTRGAPSCRCPAPPSRRIIPAYAGSTKTFPRSHTNVSDHPRIRGEHADGVLSRMSIGGSSPHTRGAPARPGHPAPVAGIIPAYAGSTTYDKTGSYLEPDHPRIRGEHENTPPGFNARVGSSPHTRGARGSVRAGRCRIGIIPAYAGSTPPAPKSRNTGRDHPRIRGEHRLQGMPVRPDQGSSPHTRGAPKKREDPENAARIIPAYAGSTGTTWSAMKPTTDHPRIRGEHERSGRFLVGSAGSSPHTRGARPGGRSLLLGRGIIPAYAGSTAEVPANVRRHEDHPRIRGEHSATQPTTLVIPGSSPHTRGALTRLRRILKIQGIIPAYAGSTSSYPTCELPRTDHPRIRGEH